MSGGKQTLAGLIPTIHPPALHDCNYTLLPHMSLPFTCPSSHSHAPPPHMALPHTPLPLTCPCPSHAPPPPPIHMPLPLTCPSPSHAPAPHMPLPLTWPSSHSPAPHMPLPLTWPSSHSHAPPPTVMQQRKTRRKACPTPAIPTIQLSRRNRITPRMFCSVGRYTPIMVPRLAWGGGSNLPTSVYHYYVTTSATPTFFFLLPFPLTVLGLGWIGSYCTRDDSSVEILGRCCSSSCGG